MHKTLFRIKPSEQNSCIKPKAQGLLWGVRGDLVELKVYHLRCDADWSGKWKYFQIIPCILGNVDNANLLNSDESISVREFRR